LLPGGASFAQRKTLRFGNAGAAATRPGGQRDGVARESLPTAIVVFCFPAKVELQL
jgi:hypothetical protein